MKKQTIALILGIVLFNVTHAQNDSEMTDSSNENKAKGEILTFLTFQKEDAEQAMNFYISLFDNSKVLDIQRWGAGMPSKEGTIMYATFQLNGSLYMCSDSPPIHEWDFNPAVSNFVNCSDEAEQEFLFTKLSENGKVLMPLNNYGFSQKIWVCHRPIWGIVAIEFAIVESNY